MSVQAIGGLVTKSRSYLDKAMSTCALPIPFLQFLLKYVDVNEYVVIATCNSDGL